MNTIARHRLAHLFLSTPALHSATDVVRALGAVQAQDFGSAKWAVAQRTKGLTAADGTRAIAIARTSLARAEFDGRTYWQGPGSPVRSRRVGHLLPNYDEFIVGFRDRSAVAERLLAAKPRHKVDGLIGHVVVVDGQIVGGWRRTLGKTVEVVLQLSVPLTAREQALVQRATERFGEFLGVPVRVRRAARSAKARRILSS